MRIGRGGLARESADYSIALALPGRGMLDY